MKKIPEEELIDDIKRVAKLKEDTPTLDDMEELGKHASRTYQRRLGSWKQALIQAGFRPNRELAEEEMIKDIRRLEEKLGRTPTTRDVHEQGQYGVNSYYRTFGSWNDAIEKAELQPNSHYNISKEELIEDIKRTSEEFEKVVTKEEYRKRGEFGPDVCSKKFGSWNKALRKAGYEPVMEKGIEKDKLISEIIRLAEEIGKKPTSKDMEDKGEYSLKAYTTHFGYWNDALEEAGFDPWNYDTMPSKTEHWAWKGGREPYYGENWKTQNERCRRRDNYICQECGIHEDEHLEKIGTKLHVHHITPRREFEVVEESNVLENLVLLCSSCHRKIELEDDLKDDE